jgi:site-specific DNA recombinase
MKRKRFIGFARVSSREQAVEGHSLETQEEAIRAYAERNGGDMVRFWIIAETASKRQKRTTFQEIVSYAKKHAKQLDGMLFFKIDRAARNLADFVTLEQIENEFDLPFISVTQPMQNNAAGRLGRRMMGVIAAHFAEDLAETVSRGLAKRADRGYFVGHTPYGYKNVRKDGQRVVEVDPVAGPKVTRMFHLYAYDCHTLQSLQDKLCEEGVEYLPSKPRIPKSKLAYLLQDRSYIGELRFNGGWKTGGKHPPLVDQQTWLRVQAILGNKVCRSHSMTYASGLIQCAHCKHLITGELKTKQTQGGPKDYLYYRCTHYNAAEHPKVRMTEAAFDEQTLGMFDRLRFDDPVIQGWFVRVLKDRTQDEQKEAKDKVNELTRQLSFAMQQQDKLFGCHAEGTVDSEQFNRLSVELRDRVSRLKLQIESYTRGRDQNTELAIKAFELSQNLGAKWVSADYTEKRKILDILLLNCCLRDRSLEFTMRKPFDVLAERLIWNDSGGAGN